MNKASVIIVLHLVVLAWGKRNDGMAMTVVKSDQREVNTEQSFHPPPGDHAPIEPFDNMGKTHPKERPIPVYHYNAANENSAYHSTPVHGRPHPSYQSFQLNGRPHPSYQSFQQNARPYSAYQSTPLNEKPSYAYNSTPLNGRPNYAYQRPDAFPRPVDEHILMRPPPMLDADMHFAEDVHYNVYRPKQERNDFPHIVSDQHVMPRPSIPGIQNYFTPNRGNGNFVLDHDSAFSNQNHRPLNSVSMGGLSLNGDHRPSGAPIKPGVIILANNVFIHPPIETHDAPRPLPFNPPSLIRFDNGRDHHVNTDPIKIENNIEFVEIVKSPLFNKGFMTTSKKDYISKPYTHSVDKDTVVTSMKPDDINTPYTVNKGQYNTLNNIYQGLLQSAVKPIIKETDAQFHPLLSPMTTLTPKESPLSQSITVDPPSSATDGNAIKNHVK